MVTPAIAVNDLTYSYGELMAVNHISFEVAEGQILGFLGPNGAGKTTTVKMLTGQIKPKGGKATILGMDVSRNVDRVQGDIGVCFEVTNLYEQMSAIENLRLFARIFNLRSFNADALLERVGLSGRGKERVEGYSKGMKQRLMVARSIMHKPKILFLDEPTSGLDPTSSEAIREIILEERQRGATILLTTHDMFEADKL
jgi:ABC-2 type transport system ATP-binding protein